MSTVFSYINRDKPYRIHSFLFGFILYAPLDTMESRSLNIVRICTIFLLITQFYIAAKGIKKTSDVNQFTVENQRMHTRQNYIMKRAMDPEISDKIHELGPTYSNDYSDTETSPEEVPSFIVDYANMIRNDVILLDNSVETRTRKRGNLKVEKYNQSPMDLRCSCKSTNKQVIDLGEEYFPRFIETKNCSQILCPSHNCQKSFYAVTILKKTANPKEVSEVEVPRELKHRWVAFKIPVVVGCVCTRDYIVS